MATARRLPGAAGFCRHQRAARVSIPASSACAAKVTQAQELRLQFRRRLPFQRKKAFGAGAEGLAQRQRQRRALLLVITFEEDMGGTAIDSDGTDQSPPRSLDPVTHPELGGLREDELAPGANPFVTGIHRHYAGGG